MHLQKREGGKFRVKLSTHPLQLPRISQTEVRGTGQSSSLGSIVKLQLLHLEFQRENLN